MPLPDTVRVKISSEAAESIAMTRVVARDMPIIELIEMMLGLTGKDARRVGELLLRGTLVSGASRFRWQGWEAAHEEIEAALAAFPDHDPSRPFDPDRCASVLIRAGSIRVPLTREVAGSRRAFRSRSFWDVLMEFAAEARPRYREYSYKEKADVFVAEIGPVAALSLQSRAGDLRYSSLEAAIRRAAPEVAEFFVPRL